jgi:ferric-dicitrate binding protein FerR (iron transport regulator)
MEQKLHNYFIGKLSGKDKSDLFTAIENDVVLKERFIELQNIYATAGMLPVPGDEECARKGMSELRDIKRRKSLRRIYIRISRYAAAILLTAVVATGLVRYMSRADRVEYAEAVAPVGKRMELSLSDGTKVWLAPCSKLVYPVKFSRKQRTVELSGEALFDVTSDAKTPFEVHSDDYNVRVLGTVFNVSSYNDVFETTLIEGSVEVYNSSRGEDKITLRPNQQAYLSEGMLAGREVDASQALYLQNGIYNFHDITLGEIMSKLEVWYGVTINIADHELMNAPFAAKLREGDDIDTILRALQKTSGFRFRYEEPDTISIY